MIVIAIAHIAQLKRNDLDIAPIRLTQRNMILSPFDIIGLIPVQFGDAA